MSIRAVIFDLGGVILRTEYQAPRQHLAERFGMDYDDIEKIVFGGGPSGSSARASVGEITEEEHWMNVAKVLKQPVSEYESLRAEFYAGDVIDYQLLDFLRSLKPKYKTALISNAWTGLRDYITREKFEDAFDLMIISAEVNVAKPDERIFRMALEQLGVQPEEAVFVDDFIENVEASETLGMHAIQFKTTESTLKQLQKLLAA